MSAEGLTGLLRSFRLPTMARIWEESVERAERENWGYKRLLQHLFESEEQDRRERKMARLLKESGLPEGKTLGNLEEKLLTPKIRRILPTLLEGHFVERAENILAFGLPGRGKSHFLAALGRELILRHRYEVLFTPTYKLVQRLLAAKKDFRLEAELKRLDRYAVVICDDIGYVQQDRQEMEVFFTFLAERYERRSVLITSNLVFSKWDQIFKDPMTTMAAVDRLVHHATILEFTGPSIRDPQGRDRRKGQADAPEAIVSATEPAKVAPNQGTSPTPPSNEKL